MSVMALQIETFRTGPGVIVWKQARQKHEPAAAHASVQTDTSDTFWGKELVYLTDVCGSSSTEPDVFVCLIIQREKTFPNGNLHILLRNPQACLFTKWLRRKTKGPRWNIVAFFLAINQSSLQDSQTYSYTAMRHKDGYGYITWELFLNVCMCPW